MTLLVCGCGYKEDKFYTEANENGWRKIELTPGVGGVNASFKKITLDGETYWVVLSANGTVSLTPMRPK